MPSPNQATVNLVKEFEGCVLHPYQDAVGVWTIGYGHTGGYGGLSAKTQPITQEHADLLLREDLQSFADDVNDMLSHSINPNQFGALVSFAYNLGSQALRDSTLLMLVNEGNYTGAQEQFKYWVYAGGEELPGLVRRRAAEASLFGS